ncbi:uncharacterized protein VTP21DRAFT_9454 [Calcarisporiella thermophila]|uniref:uncharacterized protein n=1 Tax=Calcarisporiella thermophila TaxID=911321 RepID=UPI0037431023
MGRSNSTAVRGSDSFIPPTLAAVNPSIRHGSPPTSKFSGFLDSTVRTDSDQEGAVPRRSRRIQARSLQRSFRGRLAFVQRLGVAVNPLLNLNRWPNLTGDG